MWNIKIIDTDKALYIAIADAIEKDIKDGKLRSGEKLPTHRDLAQIVGVNVTTATRAYKEAEKRGLIKSVTGSGTFVASDLGRGSSFIIENESAGIIEMGTITPLYSVEPDIAPICKKVASSKNINSFMRYAPPQGIERHRRIGADWVKQFGISANENNIIITSGTQHAINCVLSSCFGAGDCIAVDYLTYPGVKSAAKRCGIKLEGIMTDREGIIPSRLEAACKRLNIKGIYTSASMQNPTNSSMTDKRKIEIADIIRRENLLLIEDDIYAFLSVAKPSALSALVPERSVYIAGTAKAFFAGLRVGFVVSPQQYYNKICQAVVDSVWMTPPMNAEIVCECIGSGLADEIISSKREEIRKRFAILSASFAGYEHNYEPDNMFVWLKLPEEWDSLRFEIAARQNGVRLISSDKFAVGGIPLPKYVRVSLSSAENTSEFEKGVDILSKLLRRGNDEIVRIM